jgi:hypothetical protein
MSAAAATNAAPAQISGGAPPLDPNAYANEQPADSALVAAQTLWGRGNLSPLENILGMAVIANLVPKGEMGFIGQLLGQRMHKYAEDKGIWIDAVEAEPALSQIHKKPQTTIRLFRWGGATEGLKTNRYTYCAAFHASAFAVSLDEVYGKCAAALKVKGTLLVGDVMWTAEPGTGAPLPGGRTFHSLDGHKAALSRAGMKVERTLEFSDNLKSAIYAGLVQSTKDLAEWRALPARVKDQRKAALMEQLELWAAICTLIQRKMLCVTGLIASKLPAAAGKA